jgi:hypothetical protein
MLALIGRRAGGARATEGELAGAPPRPPIHSSGTAYSCLIRGGKIGCWGRDDPSPAEAWNIVLVTFMTMDVVLYRSWPGSISSAARNSDRLRGHERSRSDPARPQRLQLHGVQSTLKIGWLSPQSTRLARSLRRGAMYGRQGQVLGLRQRVRASRLRILPGDLGHVVLSNSAASTSKDSEARYPLPSLAR